MEKLIAADYLYLGQHDGRGVNKNTKRASWKPALVSLKVRQFVATIRLVWHLLRQYLFGIVGVGALTWLYRHPEAIRGKRRLALAIVAVDFVFTRELSHYFTDPVYRLMLLGHTKNKVKPGLYYNRHIVDDGRVSRIVKRCHFEEYKSPSFLIHGDLRSVIPTIAQEGHVKPVRYHRFCVQSASKRSERHGINLDWSFPSSPTKDDEPIVLLLAGVGGDSNAPYMKEAVRMVNEECNWKACVLLARGLGCSEPVENIENIFDPSDLHDIHETLLLIDRAFPGAPILMAGFSLGGLMLCNLLGRFEIDPKINIAGAVAVSGGFKCEFMKWTRYESIYQPVIVPKLVQEIMERYEEQLPLSEKEKQELLESSTYSDLYERFFAKMTHPLERKPLHDWIESQEGFHHKSNIKVPLLLFAACDDPLHHPDMIGADATEVIHEENSNIVYFLTSEGGHVGWPTSHWPKEFQYINSVLKTFFRACIIEH